MSGEDGMSLFARGAPCNICGVGWPNHADACAYVANVRALQSASAEANALRLRLKGAVDALRQAEERLVEIALDEYFSTSAAPRDVREALRPVYEALGGQ